MEAPSLEGVQAPVEGGEPAPTSQQKLAVAAGVAAIGAFIGYSLVQSYRRNVPQALWRDAAAGVERLSSSPPSAARVSLVNMPEDVRPAVREGLQAWLDLRDEVVLDYPTVMFVEEQETSSFTDIGGDVRRAALFAHAELHSGKAASGRRCTVVYRSVAEVNGQPLDDWDVDAAALRRWHGKSFVQRHCLAFTVDGTTAATLMYDVEGVLLTSRPASAAKVTVRDAAELLRECGVPSAQTFRAWAPQMADGDISAAAAKAFDSDPKRSLHAEKSRHGSLWRSPYALFSLLGVVLRYNRPDFAVYPALLSLSASTSSEAGAGEEGVASAALRRLCAAAPAVWQPLWVKAAALHHRRRHLLSAPFVLLVQPAEGGAPPPSGLADEVRLCVSSLLGHVVAVPAERSQALVEVQREKAGQWGLCVDLSWTRVSVVEGGWLMARLEGLLGVVGVSLARVRLIAVPKDPSDASLLYPTAAVEPAAHYWRPVATSATKSPASAAGAKLADATSAPRHPGWVSVNVRGKAKLGFVVALHEFTAA